MRTILCKKWKLALLYVLAVFVLQELVFRVFFPLPEVKEFNRVNYMDIPIARMKDKGAIRNLKLTWESAPDNAVFVHNLNAYGFRDKEWSTDKPANCSRIFFVGDSFTEGTMATDTETISKGFDAVAVKAGIPVDTMNLGVMGAGLDALAQLIVDAVPLFNPDHVFLIVYANDLPAHPIPQNPGMYESFSCYKPRFVELLNIMQRGDMLPMRWSIVSRKFHSPATQTTNPWHNKEDVLKRCVRSDIAEAVLNGRFNPYRIGGSRYIQTMLEQEVDVSSTLSVLCDWLDVLGVKLHVVYLPERGQVTRYYQKFEEAYSVGFPPPADLTKPEYQRHQQYLKKNCSFLGVPFLDLTPVIRAEENKGNHVYWDYDDHMRGKGYLLIGSELFGWWNSLSR